MKNTQEPDLGRDSILGLVMRIVGHDVMDVTKLASALSIQIGYGTVPPKWMFKMAASALYRLAASGDLELGEDGWYRATHRMGAESVNGASVASTEECQERAFRRGYKTGALTALCAAGAYRGRLLRWWNDVCDWSLRGGERAELPPAAP